MIVLAWVVGIIIFVWAVTHPTLSFWLIAPVFLLLIYIVPKEAILYDDGTGTAMLFIGKIMGALVLGWVLGTVLGWGNAINRGAEIVNKLEEHLDESKK